MNKNITDKSKERSDKEFEEWWGKSLTGIKIYPNNEFVAKQAWNHLYEQLNVLKAQIKEKEDIIESLEAKVKELEVINDARAYTIKELIKGNKQQSDKIQTLEAKVKELTDDNNEADITIEKYFNKAKTLEAKVKELEECKLVNYGELDLKLSDYLKTDDIILISTKDRSEIVDHILKMVDSCSYPSEIQKETASVVEKLRGEE